MKNGKSLSRAQKKLLSEIGKNPADYLVVQNLPDSMVLLNRMTGKQESITKSERRKGK